MGADGWLIVSAGNDSCDSAVEGAIDLWNSDGSPSEISGNGTRCAAAFLIEAASHRLQQFWFGRELERERFIVCQAAGRQVRQSERFGRFAVAAAHGEFADAPGGGYSIEVLPRRTVLHRPQVRLLVSGSRLLVVGLSTTPRGCHCRKDRAAAAARSGDWTALDPATAPGELRHSANRGGGGGGSRGKNITFCADGTWNAPRGEDGGSILSAGTAS